MGGGRLSKPGFVSAITAMRSSVVEKCPELSLMVCLLAAPRRSLFNFGRASESSTPCRKIGCFAPRTTVDFNHYHAVGIGHCRSSQGRCMRVAGYVLRSKYRQ